MFMLIILGVVTVILWLRVILGWNDTSDFIDFLMAVCCAFILVTILARSNTGGYSAGTTPTDGKRPSSTRKYICPCCHNSVRATKDVHIICADCAEMMQLA